EDESDDRRHKRALVPGLTARRNAQGIQFTCVLFANLQLPPPLGCKPSLALTDVHSDLIVELLARHVVDPFTVLIHIAFDNAFGRRRAFSC
ncbi:MAG TPA: hypothetical protein VGU64_16585, partial [Terriglobales bacterium]|nr:hypothetical protein [Terriglobales bacterium]